jgi:hypothetical protein
MNFKLFFGEGGDFLSSYIPKRNGWSGRVADPEADPDPPVIHIHLFE